MPPAPREAPGRLAIDITKSGIDNAHGVRELRDRPGISLDETIFVGDALFP
jgi:phosphomannomutase